MSNRDRIFFLAGVLVASIITVAIVSFFRLSVGAAMFSGALIGVAVVGAFIKLGIMTDR